MKKLLGILLSITVSSSVFGQRNADYGIFGGVSSYFGDINTNRPLYSPLPAVGLFYRYNLHPRQAIRTNIFIGGIRGNDLDFNNDFQKERKDYFSGTVAEWAVQFEFNFLPYSTQGKKWNYTPYFAAGAGIAFIDVSANIWNPGNQVYEPVDIFTYRPVIPFSVGFKINIHKNLGLEAEYGFRKTFYDNFDGLEDKVNPDHKSWIHNNDWYSFAGISLTWKIYNKLSDCPAFQDVDESRRR